MRHSLQELPLPFPNVLNLLKILLLHTSLEFQASCCVHGFYIITYNRILKVFWWFTGSARVSYKFFNCVIFMVCIVFCVLFLFSLYCGGFLFFKHEFFSEVLLPVVFFLACLSSRISHIPSFITSLSGICTR